MAAVGHGLIGLALAGSVSARARNHRLPNLWLGIMVLLAYAVDLAEWFAVIIEPELIERRFVTHSPLLVGCVGVGACVILGAYCRFTRPWAYVVVVAVVFSHILLDHRAVRFGLFDWYFGRSLGDFEPIYPASLTAEFCVYGAALVFMMLVRASLEPGASRSVRFVSWSLALLSCAALFTRHAALWGPVYVVSMLHALIVLRRHLKLRMLWNLVPLLPLLAMDSATVWVWYRAAQGHQLAKQGRHQEAVGVYQSALGIPSRSGKQRIHLGLGRSYEKLGDLAEAERAYLQAVAINQTPDWPELMLADFYIRHPDTSFYRPEQAIRFYTLLLQTRGTHSIVQDRARAKLRRLRERDEGP